MLLDQATDAEMAAARVFSGAMLVAFLGAPIFRRQAQTVRMVVAGLYLAGVNAALMYFLVF